MRVMAQLLTDIHFDGVVTIESVPHWHYPLKDSASDKRILETFAYWKRLLTNCK